MKKILMILGGIFVFLIVVVIILFLVLALKGIALENEGKAYVDEVTPIILANLNKETLFQYASYELKNSATEEDFDKIFNWFAKLGKFKKYKGSSCENIEILYALPGKGISGIYKAQAEFENGPATITITTIKKGDNWQVIGFHIESMALVD